ncbi:DNA repair protein RAD51 homolog 4-like [Adelges cooleyi]|uniref:DNA repair protein RAD51 homolog 4-like n=1 Tax=Adelges cooleyi TaxID=133065 RepID=UPI00217F5231|nr:DNA repair protein RAD51 homolog 4-like [Adelges cooleyi]
MMRLNVPMITSAALVDKLLSRNVFTVFDFLQRPNLDLQDICNLSCKEVSKLKDNIMISYCSDFINAFILYSNSSTNCIQTGIVNLDELLNGGLRYGNIYEFCGPSACGKTQLCYSIISNISITSRNIIFIDTKCEFSIKRIKEIIYHTYHVSKNQMKVALDKIHVYSILEIYSLISCLHSLKEKSELIIIIDSIPVLYLPFVGSSKNEGLCFMNHIHSILKRLCKNKSIVLLTNLAVKNCDFSNEDVTSLSTKQTEYKPAIGKYWLHVPSTRLMLTSKQSQQYVINVTISKSVNLPINKNCILTLNNKGVL